MLLLLVILFFTTLKGFGSYEDREFSSKICKKIFKPDTKSISTQTDFAHAGRN